MAMMATTIVLPSWVAVAILIGFAAAFFALIVFAIGLVSSYAQERVDAYYNKKKAIIYARRLGGQQEAVNQPKPRKVTQYRGLVKKGGKVPDGSPPPPPTSQPHPPKPPNTSASGPRQIKWVTAADVRPFDIVDGFYVRVIHYEGMRLEVGKLVMVEEEVDDMIYRRPEWSDMRIIAPAWPITVLRGKEPEVVTSA